MEDKVVELRLAKVQREIRQEVDRLNRIIARYVLYDDLCRRKERKPSSQRPKSNVIEDPPLYI